MDICENIPDPVIAPSGKIFSASGLRRLAEALCVDKSPVLWRRCKCHESEKQKKVSGTGSTGSAAS